MQAFPGAKWSKRPPKLLGRQAGRVLKGSIYRIRTIPGDDIGQNLFSE